MNHDKDANELDYNKRIHMGISMNKRQVGQGMEGEAIKHLVQNGYKILENNYYTPKGEIDIIAKEGDYLVFLEVKYRKNVRYGYPEEAIDARKQIKIKNTSRYYIMKNKNSYNIPCRYDVVVILGSEIKIIKNAFE